MAKPKMLDLEPLPQPEETELRWVGLADILPSPLTARTIEDEAAMEELVQSIRQDGLLYPIKVRDTLVGTEAPAATAPYQVVCGHRRLEAIRRLGRVEVQVEV